MPVSSAQEATSQNVSNIINESQQDLEKRFENQAQNLRKQLNHTRQSYQDMGNFISTLQQLPSQNRTDVIRALQTDSQIMLGFAWYDEWMTFKEKNIQYTKQDLQPIFDNLKIVDSYTTQLTDEALDDAMKVYNMPDNAKRSFLQQIERIFTTMIEFKQIYNSK